jgi:hypothetical protein
MQISQEHITVSSRVKIELERRKKLLSAKAGKKVSFDLLLRRILGMC